MARENGKNAETKAMLRRDGGFYIPMLPASSQTPYPSFRCSSFPHKISDFAGELHQTVGFCFSKILRLCRSSRHEIRLSYCREKCACCHTLPCCRVRRPLLSASTGSKGITHSTFLRKIVCQQGCSRSYWKPGVKGALPLKFLIFLAGAYANCKNAACNACSENEKNSAAARYAYGSTAFFY